MFRCIKYLLLTAGLIIAVKVPAQKQRMKSDYAVSEVVYLHIDKQVYVAGEPIRYKAYLVNVSGNDVPCSKIIYFNLKGTGPDNQLSWRINIDSTSAAGSLLIPENISPGMYVLTAYTNWMRNNSPSACFSDRIVITSLITDQSSGLRLFKLQNPVTGKGLFIDDASLSITTGKNVYRINEPVRLEMTLDYSKHVAADISVSVNALSPLDSFVSDPSLNSFISTGQFNRRNPADCPYKIEDRGFILSGRVIANPSVAYNRCDVWLAVADSVTPRILFAQSDTSGAFRFFLDRSFDNKELIIQLADPAMSGDCKLEIFGKDAILADSVTFQYSLTREDQAYLSVIKNIRLIEAVYGNKEVMYEATTQNTRPAFLNVPDRVVIPSDFIDLRNFRDIASNIVPEVRFGNRHDQFYLEVLSPNINLWKENFLVMLNGVPFTDLAYISTLGTKDIRRIEVIQPNVLIGKFTLPGLVSIFTYDGKIPENYLKSRTVRYQNNVMPAVHGKSEHKEDIEEKGRNLPDFSNSVYWEPFVKMSSGNKVVLEFPSRMVTGNFVIRAEGITDDGIPVSATGYFEVTE